MAAARVTGHVLLKERQRGAVYYMKYRLTDGRQVMKLLGPAWTERSRPPAGYYTKRTAEEELNALLAGARRGTLPDSQARSGRTFGDACIATSGDRATQRLVDDLVARPPAAIVQTDLAKTQLLSRDLAVGVRQQDQLGTLQKQLYAAATPLVTQANDQRHPEVSKFVETVKARYPGSLLTDILLKRP